ncbi:MAG: transposase [Nostoc sp.]
MFKDFAARGKTCVDWFFGLKLHIVINQLAEILNVIFTPGNIDDRKPIPDLLKDLFCKIFTDRGYVWKQLADKLYSLNSELIRIGRPAGYQLNQQ